MDENSKKSPISEIFNRRPKFAESSFGTFLKPELNIPAKIHLGHDTSQILNLLPYHLSAPPQFWNIQPQKRNRFPTLVIFFIYGKDLSIRRKQKTCLARRIGRIEQRRKIKIPLFHPAGHISLRPAPVTAREKIEVIQRKFRKKAFGLEMFNMADSLNNFFLAVTAQKTLFLAQILAKLTFHR